jgi:signal transduction histidine kinase
MSLNSSNAGSKRGRSVSPGMLLATMLFFFASAAGVVLVARYTGQVDGIWISNAVLLAVLMKHGRQSWPAIIAVGFVANVAADVLTYHTSLAVLFALLNLVEILAVALPLRLLKLDREFTRPHALLVFYALAVGPATILAASLGASYFHMTSGTPFLSTIRDWYSADALGLVIVVPPLMTVRLAALKAMFGRDQIVSTLLLIGVVVITILLNYFAKNYPIAFLFFPAVVLLTFQRGFAGGSIGLLLTAIYLIVPALVGQSSGSLGSHSVREQVMVVQIFIAVMGFSVVLVGAALEERRKLEQGLAAAIARAENSREEAIVAKDAAEKANRSKSMFLATMSHELRTPLNAVIGFAELMHTELFGPLGDKRYREYSDVIQNAGRHLLDLINDILDMSKIEAGKQELDCEEISVDDIVHDCLDLMSERAAHGGVKLLTDMQSAPSALFADRRAMKQILLNILSNAIKFTPNDGEVTTRIRVADGLLVLSVRDTGVGIPADQIYRLGNPFVQLRNNAGASATGSGLGLALVRALTEMHRGTFKIESVEAHGTTVTISIPLAQRASLAA